MSEPARIAQETRSTQVRPEQELREAFFQRMILARIYSGRTNADIARRCRATQSSVASWFDPRVKAMPEGIKMLQLPWALGVNGHWLTTGEGQMVEQDGHPENQGAREAIARTQAFLDTMRVEVGRREA